MAKRSDPSRPVPQPDPVIAPVGDDDELIETPAEEDDRVEEAGPQRCTFVLRKDLDRRIDQYLQQRLKGISRNKVQQLIAAGGVTVNGKTPKCSTLLGKGDVVDVILPPRAVKKINPEPIPLDVLYEDDAVIVLNKQANLIIHPARGRNSGTLVHGLAYHFKQQLENKGGQWKTWNTRGFNVKDRERHGKAVDSSQTPLPPGEVGRASRTGARTGEGTHSVAGLPSSSMSRKDNSGVPSPQPSPMGRGSEDENGFVAGLSSVGVEDYRPGIIHRLDKNTTGVIVVAKNDQAHWQIARQFEDRSTLKAYLAIVHGNLDEASGIIEEPIGKHPSYREAYAIRRDSAGKHALTIFRVREQYKGYALVELELKTGRTHQIRVHLSYLGHPIVGDIVYGGEPIGPAELDHPVVPAASRKFVTYARSREDGLRVEEQAKKRGEIILAHPALHAALLQFVHPFTKETMRFNAHLHQPMLNLVHELRKRRIDAPVMKEGWWVDLKQAVPG